MYTCSTHWDKRVTKLYKKCPLHLKYALALHWEIWGDRFNRQRSTYMYILIDHRIKIVKRIESYIIFTLHACNVRLKCREIVKTHQKRVNSLNHSFIERAVGVVAPASTCLRLCWRQTFRAYDVKTMWLTTRSTIFERITASGFVAIQWFIKMYM